MIESNEQRIVDEAITSRHSMRAFLPTPVAREDIERMLEVAARAPSGSNIQPWKVYVLTGAIKQRLSDAVTAAFLDPNHAAIHKAEYRYYPDTWASPFIERRRKVGLDLYRLLGLGRDDKAGMQAQHARKGRHDPGLWRAIWMEVFAHRATRQAGWNGVRRRSCGLYGVEHKGNGVTLGRGLSRAWQGCRAHVFQPLSERKMTV